MSLRPKNKKNKTINLQPLLSQEKGINRITILSQVNVSLVS